MGGVRTEIHLIAEDTGGAFRAIEALGGTVRVRGGTRLRLGSARVADAGSVRRFRALGRLAKGVTSAYPSGSHQPTYAAYAPEWAACPSVS
jgi:hypothetical protein